MPESRSISPNSYAALVDLYAPFDRTAHEHPVAGNLAHEVAAWLLEEDGRGPSDLPPEQDDVRRLIAVRLTRRPPRPIPAHAQRLLDNLWAAEPGLDDLEIAQCLFAGEDVTNPNHVAVIAHGNGINVHHCVFLAAKISVVYWTPGSTGHAMTHCVVHGVYGSGVWTAGIASDFVYWNNVISGCNYVWTAQGGASAQADAGGRAGQPPAAPQGGAVSYKVEGSFVGGNSRLAGSGTGARLEYSDIDPSFLTLVDTKIVDQPVELQRDQTKIDYLHPIAGSDAARVGAGLFTKVRAQ